MIGDPASGKTLAKEIVVGNFKDVSNVGAISTRAGLLVNMGTGQLGVLGYRAIQTGRLYLSMSSTRSLRTMFNHL